MTVAQRRGGGGVVRRPRDVSAAVLFLVAAGGFLVTLNSTMIAVALPTLIDDFDASVGAATMLITSYVVAAAIVQPLGGRLGDRLGRRPLVLAGLVWFGLASALAATASSLAVLIAWRTQQAVAGALVLPNAIGLLRELVSEERLGSRVGTATAALPLGAAAGPPLGGLLLSASSWHAIFLVNLPIVAAALVVAWRRLPVRAPEARVQAPRRGGALALLRNGRFLAAGGAIALSNMGMYVGILGLPILLAARSGFSHAGVGALLGTMFLTTFVVSPFGGLIADRAGRRVPAVAGLALEAGGLFVLALSPTAISAAALVAPIVAIGAGIGLSGPAIQVAALEAAEVRLAGVASGLYQTMRYLGSIIGTALFAAPLAPGPGTDGFGLLFSTMAGATAGGIVLAALLPGRALGSIKPWPPPRPMPSPPPPAS